MRERNHKAGLKAVAVAAAISALSAVLIRIGAPTAAVPGFYEVRQSYIKSDAFLLDRRGEVIHELRVDFQRRRLGWTPLDRISPALIRAVIHSEDRRFKSHRGVDWPALPASLASSVLSARIRGGSTITMQLAAMLGDELNPEKTRRTVKQKLVQMKTALAMEEKWSKDEILEAYLNLLSFRGELVGVRAASRGLFGKEPGGLDDSESLILASLIRSPNAPMEDVVKRACALGASQGKRDSREQIEALVRNALSGSYSIMPRASLAPHVARSLLKDGKKNVRSTLDGALQRYSEKLLSRYLLGLRKKHVDDGAVLVADNATGEILAYVANGGAESSAPYVDGIRAKRQAGSTLKPFLYGLAFESRILTPASLLDDGPIDVATRMGIYSPENYDNDFKGIVTARTALASSINMPAVRTLSLIGEEPFVRKLKDFGLEELREGDYYGLSLALGTADVSLRELVNAYRTLANGGVFSETALIFNDEKRPSRRALSEGAAFIVSDILSDREARSATFGLENPLSTRFWSAVKTGTSKDMRDNWCIGYSSGYTVGVWVGNFSGEPMWDVSGMSGAAPLWFEIMNYLHRETESKAPLKPRGVISKEVVFNETKQRKKEFFLEGAAPDIVALNKRTVPPRITYPPSQAVLAIDPDVPPGHQRLFLESNSGSEDVLWMMDGMPLARGSTAYWTPERGAFTLSLVQDGRPVDEVSFQVR